MKKNYVITIVVVVVIVVIGIWIYSSNNTNNIESNNSAAAGMVGNTSTNPSSSQSSTAPTTNTAPASDAGQLLSTSEYAQNSYLISGATMDTNTKKALTGFSVSKKTMTDGSTQITLIANNPEYKTQVYDVQKGQKLYFIESNLSDDSGTTDKFPGDDQAIIVDANGYIVQAPQGDK